MIYYIRNIDLNFIMGVYFHLSTYLYICKSFSDLSQISVKKRNLTEFGKGRIVGTHIAGASVTKTPELFFFRELPRTMTEF